MCFSAIHDGWNAWGAGNLWRQGDGLIVKTLGSFAFYHREGNRRSCSRTKLTRQIRCSMVSLFFNNYRFFPLVVLCSYIQSILKLYGPSIAISPYIGWLIRCWLFTHLLCRNPSCISSTNILSRNIILRLLRGGLESFCVCLGSVIYRLVTMIDVNIKEGRLTRWLSWLFLADSCFSDNISKFWRQWRTWEGGKWNR